MSAALYPGGKADFQLVQVSPRTVVRTNTPAQSSDYGSKEAKTAEFPRWGIVAHPGDSKFGARTQASFAVTGCGLTIMTRVSFLENRGVNGLVSASHALPRVLLSMSMAL